MSYPTSLRRFEVPTANGSSRIVSLPATTPSSGAKPVAPEILTTFEDRFRAALAQTAADYELNCLFNSEVYEI